MTAPAQRIVVTDANVLINLMHVGRLDACLRLPNHDFIVPDHVREEIKVAAQRATLDSAVTAGLVVIGKITEPSDIALFAKLTVHLGRGEAACLVLAERYGWAVASDEKRRFRREALDRIGEDRIIGTDDLFVLMIQAGAVTLEEADTDKAALEGKRFRMPFGSFRDRVAETRGRNRGRP